MEERKEKDMLGEENIPENVYWGIHTFRALNNFVISGKSSNVSLIKAYAMVKKACALTNMDLGYLQKEKACAIIAACDEIMQGKHKAQFMIDALQGGAGTSTNMNVNEVIANRALELCGKNKGDYDFIGPIDEVNMHQSTNDTFPTALKVASIFKIKELCDVITMLQGRLQGKEKTFAGMMKIGRTEMQEAVPMTLGAEFGSYAQAIARDRWRTFKCEERLREVNLGGTAIGTGLTAPRKYIFNVIEKLRTVTGLGISRSENMIDLTANNDVFVEVSGILKAHASNLIKICNDLRLLALLGEIELPKVQAGSSIMPEKANPVIPEAVIQAGLKVFANDMIITETVSRGTLEINEFMPLLADAFLDSFDILINSNIVLEKHIEGIKADDKKCGRYLSESLMTITSFVPELGYEKAGELMEQYKKTGGRDLKMFLEDKLGKDIVQRTLSPENLNAPGHN